jgi:probable F420-dependent oxidoreductase
MAITFGVTVLPDPPHQQFLELIELAEQQGFEVGWTYDSHVLWHESIPLLTLAAERTSTMKLGHFVTNPGTREPTVLASAYATMHVLSGGRMVMGIGRGDSARRVIGLQPVKMAEFETSCRMIRDFMNGREVSWNGKDLKLEWALTEPEIPLYVAGYGPKALAVAGRVSDGVIIQLADPVIVQWIMSTAREAAEKEGRDPDALECIVGAPSKVGDDMVAIREEVRWFPAMVSNHVMDLIERYGWNSDIPSELTDFVKVRKGYDYKDHSRVGAKHGEFVTDEICDRFCVIGTAEQCTDKLRELEGVGVDQFNLYLMTHGRDEVLRTYGSEIIPQFTGVAS